MIIIIIFIILLLRVNKIPITEVNFIRENFLFCKKFHQTNEVFYFVKFCHIKFLSLFKFSHFISSIVHCTLRKTVEPPLLNVSRSSPLIFSLYLSLTTYFPPTSWYLFPRIFPLPPLFLSLSSFLSLLLQFPSVF